MIKSKSNRMDKKNNSSEMQSIMETLNKHDIQLLLTGELSSEEQVEVLEQIFRRVHKYSTEYKMLGDDFDFVSMYYYDHNLAGIYKPDPIVNEYLEITFGESV